MSALANAALLEHLIRELNDTTQRASPDRVRDIQKHIQRLQQDQSAWEIGLDFLDHDDSQIRFYGALTLTIKINASWDIDKIGTDRSLTNQLVERLVASYVRLILAGDAPFVLRKLATTLVALFQRPNSAWAFPVRHVLACCMEGRYLPQENVPDMQNLLRSPGKLTGSALNGLLLLTMTMAEEAGSLVSPSKAIVQVHMANNSNDIWYLLDFAMDAHSKLTGSFTSDSPYKLDLSADEQQLKEIASLCMQIVPLWIGDVKASVPHKDHDDGGTSAYMQFRKVFNNFLILFQHSYLATDVIQTVTTLEQHCHNLLVKARPDYAIAVVEASTATSWISQLVAGDFDPNAVAYADFLDALFGEVDTTNPSYLQQPQYVKALMQVQTLLECDGVAGIEDPVCQIALEILGSVVEGFEDWEGHSGLEKLMRELVQRACRSCLLKIKMPVEELAMHSQTWDADERARFQDFRYEVRDFLQNAFSMLGMSLVEGIVEPIVAAQEPYDWLIFEANLTALLAFVDNFNSEPEKYNDYLRVILDSRAWHHAYGAQTPERVRQVMIKMISENSSFLQKQPNYVIPSLNFLFQSLHVSASITSASRAIFTLCDSQRSSLIESLPQFMNSLTNISELESDAKNRIFGGVSAIMQALPTEDMKLQPLTELVSFVEHEVNQLTVDSRTLTESAVKEKVVDIVFTLSSVGKGLQSPADNQVDLEADDSQNRHFWIEGPGSHVQEKVLRLFDYLRGNFKGDQDSAFVEASANFLRTGYTEMHPSPFKFPASTSLKLLCSFIKPDIPQPDLVMGLASAYLAATGPEEEENGFDILISGVTIICQNIASAQESGQPFPQTDFCTASLEFFTRLLPRWAAHWFQQPGAEQQTGVVFEIALALVQDPDVLTRRTAASFFSSFAEVSVATAASTLTQSLLQAYTPRIIATMLYLLGGECARSEIEMLALPLKAFVQKYPLLTNRIIKEALKTESSVLTPKALESTRPEQRARLASQIEMLRGSRKTNEILRDFWVNCRGGQFGYTV